MLEMTEKRQKRTAFGSWWSTLPLELREGQDIDFARRCFRAGHDTGATPPKKEFTFRTGKYLVSVWAADLADARKAAQIELDFRVANGGGVPPRAGWRLSLSKSDA
ncbi:hypothetical protein EFB14_19285 [Rhizobium fabae]|uniref:Uncharacterized protein n=1 Tax=Rhizobium fabae TaxID=573179 RepID=A0ABY0B6Q6_9HYPH|nr:hypothetical protein EFB14_19285 [Rhizobium fabae]